MSQTSAKVLSKSRIQTGIQCPKALWLKLNQPELEGPVTATTQAVFDTGNEVGVLAQKQFSGGVLIDTAHYERQLSLDKTAAAIEAGAKIIYEASFMFDNVYARVDILKKIKNGWDLIEVKSGTSVKEENLMDVAIQTWILENCGINLNKCYLMHINNQCVAPDLSNLFTQVDVTKEARALFPELQAQLKVLKKVAAAKTGPEVEIGPHCSQPYDCGFAKHCWKHIPKNNVFDLYRIGGKAWQLYEDGVIKIKDLDAEDFKGVNKRIIEVVKSGKRAADKAGIKAAIRSWEFPLSFLDFETLNWAVPVHAGTSPYNQVPYQFSCHVWNKKTSDKLEHFEHLHTSADDPRPGLVKALIASVPDTGSVVAYNMSFEKRVIVDLIEQFPKHRKKLQGIIDRLVDPLPVFNKHVYDVEFAGSFSIKAVAPALIGKELSYEGLEVGDGGEAGVEIKRLMMGKVTDPFLKDNITKALLIYCKQDTMAMVELVRWLFSNNGKD